MIYFLILIGLGAFELSLSGDYKYLTFFTHYFQVLLLILILQGVWKFFKNFKNLNIYSKSTIVLLTASWAIIACLHHPGLVNQDTFFLQSVLAQGRLWDWNTIMYSLVVNLFFNIDPSLFLFNLFMVFLFLACVYKCLTLFQPQSWIIAICVFVLCNHPLIQSSTLYVVRDNFLAILVSYLILDFAEVYFHQKKIDIKFLVKIITIYFVMSELRQESKIYILAFPVLLFFLDKPGNKKMKWVASGALLAMSAVWNFSLYNSGVKETNQFYQLSGVVHPLNYIIYKNPEGVSAEDKEKINRVFDYDSLTVYNDGRISQFHEGKFRLPVEENVWNDFLNTYEKLVLENKKLFFEERADVFLSSMNLQKSPFVFPDDFNIDSKEASGIREQYNIKRWDVWPAASELHTRYLNLVYSFQTKSMLVNTLLFGSPFQLILIFGLLLFLARSAAFNFFSTIAIAFCASRLPAVFLLGPEPQLKYYSVLIYVPVLLAILLLGYNSDKKAEASEEIKT